jgi:hypothetical protein
VKTAGALGKGVGALRRFPALFLLPLMRDVALLGLAYLGLPAVPGWQGIQLLGPAPAPDALRGFIPSQVPTLGDLLVPMAPALQPQLSAAPMWAAVAAFLLVPLAGALVQALFFGLLGDAVAGRPPGWRRALANWPGLAALALLMQMGALLLPAPVGMMLLPIYLLFYPLLPLALGVVGMPLLTALREAPRLFWGRLGAWIKLGLASMLVTFAFGLLWSFTGRSVFVALLFYPVLATALVGAAAALCLPEAADPVSPAAPGPAWILPAAAVAALVGASLGSGWVEAWKGWYPTREVALTTLHPGSNSRLTVVRVIPQPEGELVVNRLGNNMLSVASLRRGHFGWAPMGQESWPSDPKSGQPAVYHVAMQADGGGRIYNTQFLVVGEIFDPRAAFLQIGDKRFPIGQDGPIFVVKPGFPPNPPYAILDTDGQPVPAMEAKRP